MFLSITIGLVSVAAVIVVSGFSASHYKRRIEDLEKAEKRIRGDWLEDVKRLREHFAEELDDQRLEIARSMTGVDFTPEDLNQIQQMKAGIVWAVGSTLSSGRVLAGDATFGADPMANVAAVGAAIAPKMKEGDKETE